MKFKNISILILAVLIIVACFALVQYFTLDSQNNYNSQTAGSVVYIENGVSGVVTINDPFLNRTTAINVIYYPLDTGTGFIVTSNGYIITALHVVGDLEALDNEKLKILNSSDVNRYTEIAAVQGYIDQYNSQLGSELGISSGDANSTTDALNQRGLLSVSSTQQVIKVKVPNIDQNFTATLLDEGNPNTGEDVALLKLNTNLNNLPTLNISSKKPTVLEKIHMYGYPGLNSTNSSFNQQKLKPSISNGFLTTETAKNSTNSNSNFNIQSIFANLVNWFIISFTSQSVNNSSIYYGTTAETNKGESGGPVLNSQSNVIGIIIFGVESSDMKKQQIKITSSLFLSSDYIVQICKKNNISINVV
jgi:serine protease Do